MAGLALGVATIAGVGSFGSGLVDGMRQNGRVLLGGDVALLTTMRELEPDQRGWVESRAALSESLEMNAMARADAGSGPLLVGLKVVDDAWPLYGVPELRPAVTLGEALARRDGVAGVVAAPAFAEELGLEVGDVFAMGTGRFRLNALLIGEPDRASASFQLGPRVLATRAGLEDSGLLGPATFARYAYRIRLPQELDTAAFIEDLESAFPEAGWRVRSHLNANPSLGRFLERLRLFITLVGLSALLVGGVGVAGAVGTYLQRKTDSVAILKSLGATARLVFLVYLGEVLAMAAAGVAVGVAVGAVLPPVVGWFARAALPIPVEVGVYPLPLLLAAAFGLLTALVFALLPLAATRDVPAAALLRRRGLGVRRGGLRPFDIGVVAALALALAALAVATAADRALALYFLAGAGAVFCVFRIAGAGLRTLLSRWRGIRRPIPRLALSGLVGPGAALADVVVAFGIGLTILVAVVGVAANLQEELGRALPRDAPAFFFVDIQPAQIEPFARTVRGLPGVTEVASVPSMRGRITGIEGVPAAEAEVAPDVRWALEGDRGVTYAALPPANAEIVAGRWWPEDHAGPPLLSFDAELAEGMGVGIGSTLAVNVLGRDIVAEIANLRRVDWSTLGINFTLVFAPGLLEGAPHTHLATVHVDRAGEAALKRAVSDAFPNVSAIGVRDVLDDILAVLDRVDAAVRSIAGLALLAGLLVLAEAVAAQQRRRIRDAAVMKVLGATRRQLAAAFILEQLVLGCATALLALVTGGFAAWAVMRFAFEADWNTPWASLAGIAALALAVSLVAGVIASWNALARPAAPILRRE